MSDIIKSAVEHSETDGELRELQDHHGLSGSQIPLEMFSNPEMRTAGSTPAPADVGQNQHAIIPAVFPQSASAWLQIPQESVAVGEAVYSVLSTSAVAGTPIEGAEQAHSAAAFTASVLTPRRIQSSVFYSREDRMRFSGMESALRQNLSDAMANQLDYQVLRDTDEGLLSGSNLGQQQRILSRRICNLQKENHL